MPQVKQATMPMEVQLQASDLIRTLRQGLYSDPSRGERQADKRDFENCNYGLTFKGWENTYFGGECHYNLNMCDEYNDHIEEGTTSVVNIIQHNDSKYHKLPYYVGVFEEENDGANPNDWEGTISWDLKTRDQKLVYYQWLLNDSPFACAYITKDAADAIDWGVVISGHVPANVLGNACVALRHTWEQDAGTLLVDFFKVESDVTLRNLAYLLSGFLHKNMYKTKDSKDKLFHYSLSYVGRGHWTTNTRRMSEDYLRNFLAGTPVHLKSAYYVYPSPFSDDKGEQYSLEGMWSQNVEREEDILPAITDMCDEISRAYVTLTPIHVRPGEARYMKANKFLHKADDNTWSLDLVEGKDFAAIFSSLVYQVASKYQVKGK